MAISSSCSASLRASITLGLPFILGVSPLPMWVPRARVPHGDGALLCFRRHCACVPQYNARREVAAGLLETSHVRSLSGTIVREMTQPSIHGGAERAMLRCQAEHASLED